MKNFLLKHPTLIFVVGLIVLFLTQQKVIMPLVYQVIQSDAFLVDSKDVGSQSPISNTLTDIAFTHCNQHIKNKLDKAKNPIFSSKPINAWSLGNYQYVINGEFSVADKIQKYVCRITYQDGDDQANIGNFDSWSLIGLTGLDPVEQ
jgi:hypothetical protein